MRRIFCLLAAATLFVAPAMADKHSEAILDEMSSAIDSFGRYEVRFEVESGGESLGGEYFVDQDRYKLSLMSQQIYGDGTQRFTIDSRLHEVVMEVLDSTMPMVVANPARAFSALSKSFESKRVESVESENISLLLTPIKKSAVLDNALIEIDPLTKLPLSARYSSAGEIIVVKIVSFTKSDITIEPLDKLVLPEGYDIIDIR